MDKGYLKTLEAVIAIVIILLFTFAVTPKPAIDYSTPSAVASAQKYIFNQISNNETIRTMLMGIDNSQESFNLVYNAIKAIIAENIPPGYDYTFGICSMASCMANVTEIATGKSVYANDVLIASNGTVQNPKVVRIWMWRKGG